MHLLVIEDDRALAGLLRRKLVQERHVVDLAHDGPTGLEQAESGVYDAVVLDLMLPGLDGMAVARQLRADGINTPILMLTARDALQDRLQGFSAGADDYLTKPFAFEELMARLRAVIRRVVWPADDERLVVGDLVLDSRDQTVTRAGRPVTLAPKEYALLEYLMRHPGQVLSRTLIMEHVWDYGFDSYANVVDAIIRRLRKAVDEGHERPLIQTVRGIGYKIKAD
ncbi:MAG TPA: response regulator transcription factor [Chloroflexota bacterium]|jgi:two-component system OmpR family response regulator|nr:response regulator transcription factor [Chloroflexota bacterium]